jgi:hypothetical protein
MITQHWNEEERNQINDTRKKQIPVSLILQVLQLSQGCPGVSGMKKDIF